MKFTVTRWVPRDLKAFSTVTFNRLVQEISLSFFFFFLVPSLELIKHMFWGDEMPWCRWHAFSVHKLFELNQNYFRSIVENNSSCQSVLHITTAELWVHHQRFEITPRVCWTMRSPNQWIHYFLLKGSENPNQILTKLLNSILYVEK